MFRLHRSTLLDRRPLLRHAACVTLAAAATMMPHMAVAQGVLPTPGGPMHVGTTVRHLVDPSRPDLVARQAPRELVVQLWYPSPDTAGVRAPYVAPLIREAMLKTRYLGLDSATISGWGELRTHAVVDGRVSGHGLPVLVLSHGLGISRGHYSALAEELASRGYLVAAIDHPYGGVMDRADGHVITLDQDPAAGPPDSVFAVRVGEWAGDASFVVTQLLDPQTPLGAVVASHVDARAIGMLGHSLGGASALEACRSDPRFRACADLDGKVMGRVEREGPRGTTLIVRSGPGPTDAELAKRGRTRAQWEEMGRDVAAHFHGVAAKGAPGSVTLFRVRGIGHMSFSDAPFTFPEVISRFGGTALDAMRTRELVSSVVRTFFDGALGRGPRSALAALATGASELELEAP